MIESQLHCFDIVVEQHEGHPVCKKTSTAIPKGCYIYCGIAAMSAITMCFPPSPRY